MVSMLHILWRARPHRTRPALLCSRRTPPPTTPTLPTASRPLLLSALCFRSLRRRELDPIHSHLGTEVASPPWPCPRVSLPRCLTLLRAPPSQHDMIHLDSRTSSRAQRAGSCSISWRMGTTSRSKLITRTWCCGRKMVHKPHPILHLHPHRPHPPSVSSSVQLASTKATSRKQTLR